MLQKIAIPPGVNRDLTQYALEGGGWYDTDKVRFRAGMPEKIGGWVEHISEQLIGTPRSMHVWRTLNGTIITAIGTEKKVYIIRNSELIDITPVRREVTLLGTDGPDISHISAVLTSTSGSSILQVEDRGHGAGVGDYITISGASTLTGIDADVINAEHVITDSDNDGETYYIDCGVAATGSGDSGTVDMTIEYQANVGINEATFGTGWGVCGWSTGTWNDTRDCNDIIVQGRIWSLDNWGEDLIMNPWGGAVYEWDASNPNERATRIEEAPSRSQFIKVTDDRHLACFGCNYAPGSAQYAPPNIDPDDLDTLRIEWCDQEDYSLWDAGFAYESTAGDYRITGGSQIIAATKADSVMCVWTEEALHIMQAVEPPIVFRFDQLGTSTGIIAPHAHVVHNGVVIWMGDSAFYTYQNGVAPLVSPVEEYIFEGMDYTYRRKIFAALDRRNDEVSWFYPIETVEDTAVIAAASAGATTLYVETTAGFPVSGTLTVGTQSVTYTGKTDVTFTGCTIGSDVADGATVSCTTTRTEPARYATYGLKEGVWWIGRMERTAWADRGMIEYPIGARADGYLFNHDYGADAEGMALTSYLESCDFDIDEGERLMYVDRFVPDFDMEGTLDITLLTRYFPHSAQRTETIGTVTPTTEYINARVRGRQAAVTVKSTAVGDDWRLGSCRIDIQQDGGKR